MTADIWGRCWGQCHLDPENGLVHVNGPAHPDPGEPKNGLECAPLEMTLSKKKEKPQTIFTHAP
jgi:hypothetical protein